HEIGVQTCALPIYVRESRLEGRRMRADVLATEGCGRRDHQVAAYRGAVLGDAGIGLIEILEQGAGALQVLLAEVGQRQPASGAMHQLDAQLTLQRIQAAPHHYGRHPFLQCSGSETARFRYQNEAMYSGITIHSILLISTELKFRPIPPSIPAL